MDMSRIFGLLVGFCAVSAASLSKKGVISCVHLSTHSF